LLIRVWATPISLLRLQKNLSDGGAESWQQG
jgi:hypothetical protein